MRNISQLDTPLFSGILRLATALLLPLAVIVGVLHARPFDGSAVAAFFPSGSADTSCQLPCWRTIHPGVTDSQTAWAALQVIPRVRTIETDMASIAPGLRAQVFRWAWDRDYLSPEAVAYRPDGVIVMDNGLVRQTYIPSTLSLADVWRAFGAPDGGQVSTIEARGEQSSVLFNTIVYRTRAMAVMTYTACPVTLDRVWRTTVQIALYDAQSVPTVSGDAASYQGDLRARAVDAQRRLC